MRNLRGRPYRVHLTKFSLLRLSQSYTKYVAVQVDDNMTGKTFMPNDIKTDGDLLRRLQTARGLTREQLRQQRISFIYGALPGESTITRAQIERTLDQAEGQAA